MSLWAALLFSGKVLSGFLVFSTLQFGASLVSGAAADKDMRRQYTDACALYEQIYREIQISAAQLDSVVATGQVSNDTKDYLAGYGSRIYEMSKGLQQQTTSYRRTVLIMTIAQAVGVMFLIYLLVRGKEKRDSILNFL